MQSISAAAAGGERSPLPGGSERGRVKAVWVPGGEAFQPRPQWSVKSGASSLLSVTPGSQEKALAGLSWLAGGIPLGAGVERGAEPPTLPLLAAGRAATSTGAGFKSSRGG